MKTVLVCNQKGGVGKTLIADEIAFSLERAGVPYNFYDLDGQGGSLHEQVEQDGAEFAVVDTPGALQKDLVKWMRNADLIIIPTKMTNRDIPPLATMISIVKSEGITAPVIYVLNCWNHFRAAQDFEEWFRETYPNEKVVTISQSEAFTQAGALGVSVVEYKKNSIPAEQIKVLISIINYELGIKQ